MYLTRASTRPISSFVVKLGNIFSHSSRFELGNLKNTKKTKWNRWKNQQKNVFFVQQSGFSNCILYKTREEWFVWDLLFHLYLCSYFHLDENVKIENQIYLALRVFSEGWLDSKWDCGDVVNSTEKSLLFGLSFTYFLQFKSIFMILRAQNVFLEV